MTGGRCQRRRKMMGRGADGGCGTEEKPCPVSRVPAKFLAKPPEKETSPGLDFFVQTEKALAERSPFDAEDATAPAVPTLPASLASFLAKHSDSRKRHKKAHSGVDAKSSSRLERSRSSNIWVETEEYFREVTVHDIERLFDASSFQRSVTRECFSIPLSGNVNASSVGTGDAANGVNDVNANAEANGVCLDCEVVKEEAKKEHERSMENDIVDDDVQLEEERGRSGAQSSWPLSSSLGWLLGSRNKILLTSERPSKKRKLLGGDAGLEKLLVAHPSEGNSSLCHLCSLGDMGDGMNHLIVCDSCSATIHQKCYGVQGDLDESWMCFWCRHRNFLGKLSGTDSSDLSLKPCVLCPKQGGALKPVYKSSGCADFAHLFCSLWMPEVYVGDMASMEPIMNVDGIKETRRKLICYLCKVKRGTCIRCSHGSCRTSFHPICAREAKHRMEIWGKLGCDLVELRAFCSKHSEVQDFDCTRPLGDSSFLAGNAICVKHLPMTLSLSKPDVSKNGCQNGVKIAGHIEKTVTNSDKLSDRELQERVMSNAESNVKLQLECDDAKQFNTLETVGMNDSEDVTSSDLLSFVQILKKLINRGKVNAEDIALEIGVSPDSLATALSDDHMVPDLHCKIVKWFRNHAYVGTSARNLKVKVKSSSSCKADVGEDKGCGAVAVSESPVPDVVPVRSVPPHRRTKNDIRFLNDDEVLCSSEEMFSGNEVVMAEVKIDDEPDTSFKDFIPNATEKILVEPVEFEDSLTMLSPKFEGNIGISGESASVTSAKGDLVSLFLKNPFDTDLRNGEAVDGYIHPYIYEKLREMQALVPGSRGREFSSMEASSSTGICCNHQSQDSPCLDKIGTFDGVNLEQLVKARKMGFLDLSPEDEVEGELIYFQHRLLGNAVTRKHFTDDLICKIARSLPAEIDVVRKHRWDAVLVNQYLCDIREAKKQGRKEKRHMEAQAILAAATAAAAASSRISSFRKDAFDESMQNPQKLNSASTRSGLYSQLVPRAKETLSRVAVARVSSEKHSDSLLSPSDFSKEHPRSCDICRRSESILNPILVCSGCKVAVHLDCYRSVKESTGPWYCELCEEIVSSKSSRTPAIHYWEKPYFVAECGLCGGTTGAFRKTADGQWIHAFCAEWVLESTFRRGQANPVEGMDTISKGNDFCYICHRKHGVCIKCYYGHCQSTFHPSCARSIGVYMNVKTSGGTLQHKAYCEKHSVEQRAKAETQKHGVEEVKSMKQIRVELERLRLLCERIIKREKLKRELILCSHDILAAKRDSVALSVLVRTPFFPHDVSSESATTSLKVHTDDYKSCSEAIQRSDEITVDSTVSSKHRIKIPASMDIDQKTDASSTSQHVYVRKSTDRAAFSGKQIPHRPSIAPHHFSGDGERRMKPRKHTEFEKELVMTSDQASMKNQRLPKGFVYVPIGCLSKDKQVSQDARSREPFEHDG